MDTLGRHLVAEFFGCPPALLDDEARVRAAVRAAADAVGASVVALASHRYAPQGVTAVALIAESHLSIHTWPEHHYAAVDIFTCGGLDPRPGFELLGQRLAAGECRVQEIVRGLDEHVERGRPLSAADVTLLSSVARRVPVHRGSGGAPHS